MKKFLNHWFVVPFQDLLEVQFLEGEMRLHDAGGLDPSSQNVLLSGDIIGLGDPLQVVQVTDGERTTPEERRSKVKDGQDHSITCNLQKVKNKGTAVCLVFIQVMRFPVFNILKLIASIRHTQMPAGILFSFPSFIFEHSNICSNSAYLMQFSRGFSFHQAHSGISGVT